ncbi:MAG: hypothetical protein GF317_08900 [Candidatus Lokiarchaeota archaeon]|nr:hypothetical protein [Candidatus Lokiarchaeota archaeon]MBD3199829.1 hypothetical protein [Candidatus Lokiarchaeota archaeon]
MSITFQQSIICKLGGHVDSNPELLISYPPIEQNIDNPKEIISYCLPIGCKKGDIISKKYKKNILLSYIFEIKKAEHRDDLFSFSILVDKQENIELYKEIIQEFILILEKNNLLTEDIFLEYQELIYHSLNKEKDLDIENISIDLSKIFNEKRKELNKSKPKVKGSFF